MKSDFILGSHILRLKDILHALAIKKILLLLNRLCIDSNVSFQFDDQVVFAEDWRENNDIAIGRTKNGPIPARLRGGAYINHQ